MSHPIGYMHDDGATLVSCVVEDGPTKGMSRARCVECGRWLKKGWSYQRKPVDGNYVECSSCRYHVVDRSEFFPAARPAKTVSDVVHDRRDAERDEQIDLESRREDERNHGL